MKKGFILYKDNYEQIQQLSTEEKAELLDAIFEYNISGDTKPLTPIVKVIFGFLKLQFDRDILKYNNICERNRDNGLMGGRPRLNAKEPKKPSRFSGNPNNPVGAKETQNNPKKPILDTRYQILDTDTDTDTKELPPFANATSPSTPQADFVLAWGQLYESETKEKFKADRKDFVLVANLLKKYSYDDLIKKAKLLFMACKTKNLWFTKGGIADFNIGKLSSKWNELIESNVGGNHGGASKYEQTVSAARAYAQENGIG